MKLVIEIPDDEYQRWTIEGEMDAFIARNAMVNGIPLPKGHGRLIDADAAIAKIDKAYPNLDRHDIKQWLCGADTIIQL